jgi:MFS family permease
VTEEALRGAARRPRLAGAAAGWDAARLAVAAIFLLDGVTWGLWVAHLPLIKAGLRLSDLTFSYALAGIVLGAFVAQPLAGALATRVGTRRVTRPASAAACLALGIPAFAPSLPLLVAATALLGLVRGATEVPMNGQATLVEARDRVPRMSAFHGCFSLGGFLGSGLAALTLRAGLGARATLPAAGIVAAVASVLASQALLRDAPAPEHTTAERAARPSLAHTVRDRVLLALGALAFFGLFGEGAMSDWSALALQRTAGAAVDAAALGYAAFSVAMTAGRFTGDATVARLGRARTLRASGLLAAAGLTLGLTAPYALAIFGYALVGLGYANLVPILFSASGRRAGSAGIAAVSTLGYFGFVVGPPMIGGLSTLLGSLPLALGVVALFALVIALGAGAAEREGAPPAAAAPA